MNQEKKSLITKNKILEVATKLFAEKGFNETTMQDILLQCNLSKGAIYHHFKNKQEILEYAVGFELNHVTNYLRDLPESSVYSATQKLDILINFFLKNDGMKSLTNSNWVEKLPYGLLYTLRNTINILSQYIQKIIEQGNENNEFKCRYPFETASVLLLLVDVWLDPTIVNDTIDEISKKVDYIAYFLNNNNIPILTKEKSEHIKESIKTFYTKK